MKRRKMVSELLLICALAVLLVGCQRGDIRSSDEEAADMRFEDQEENPVLEGWENKIILISASE